MDVRFVIWGGDYDDLLVLEMYTAHVLNTPYNKRGHLAEEEDDPAAG